MIATISTLQAILIVGAVPPGDGDEPISPVPSISSEFLDTHGATRFHLTTRTTFANSTEAFSSSFAWAYEARAFLRITDGLAASVILPVGLVKSELDDSTTAFLGNVSVGLGGGGEIVGGPVRIRLGGSFDAHLPTTSRDVGTGLVAAIRAYEPQLYIQNFLSFRARASLDLEVAGLRAGFELGLVPAITTRPATRGALLVGAALHASYLPTTWVEPFIEVGCTTQVAGTGEVRPPLLLTPGVRFHIGELFDPAVFISMNFVKTSAVIFGLDLAMAIRHSNRKQRDRLALDPL